MSRPRVRKLLRWLLVAVILPLGCDGDPTPPAIETPATSLLVEATAGSGVDFVHTSGASPDRLLPETMGSGVAVFDVDNDGRPDLLFADGAEFAGGVPRSRLVLYRNLGEWRFERDDQTRFTVAGYSMGIAVGDVDGDGALDVVVTTVGGGDHLFRNLGDGIFEDVSESWGLEPDSGFGSSASFFDADGDGDLDLIAGRYVEWSPETDVVCKPDGRHRAYCTPEVYPAVANRFYLNLGDRFVEQASPAGLNLAGKTLGIAVLDIGRDGNLDLAIANDTVPNHLYVNLGEGRFEERGSLSGFDVGTTGRARGGMGIVAADLDGDGLDDVVVGNFANEAAGFFRSDAEGLFRDVAAEVRLGIQTLLSLTFGTLTLDLDGDGLLDLVFANGHIEPEIGTITDQRHSYAQPLQVFLNRGGSFEPAPAPSSAFVGRGLAAGDLDGDGDLDLVLTQNGREAVLLRNDTPSHEWRRVRLCGPGDNTWGYGGEVTIQTTDRTVVRRLEPGGSYLSASEPILTVGLRQDERIEALSVLWPGGGREELTLPAEDQAPVLRAGDCR